MSMMAIGHVHLAICPLGLLARYAKEQVLDRKGPIEEWAPTMLLPSRLALRRR